MKVGDNEVKDILIGDTQVLKVYRGEDVIWEKSVSPLPSGYRQVEYLESVDGQYIDTGILGNSNIKVVFDGSMQSGGTYHLFGARINFNTAMFTFGAYMRNYETKYSTNSQAFSNNSLSFRAVIEKDKNITRIYNSSRQLEREIVQSYESFDCEVSIYFLQHTQKKDQILWQLKALNIVIVAKYMTMIYYNVILSPA